MSKLLNDILSVFSPVAGLGTDILGSILGYDAQKSANDTNLQIARESNEYNERMLERQIAYNTEMWNKQNEYNSPAAQAQRLREAGFSPLRFMGQGGQAGSAQGITTPTATPAHVEPEKLDFDSISNRLTQVQQQAHERNMAEAQTDVLKQDAIQRKIDNTFRARMHVAELAKLAEDTHSEMLNGLLKEAEYQYFLLTRDDNASIIHHNARTAEANADMLHIEKQIKDFDLKHIEERHVLAMEEAMAKVEDLLLQTALKYQQHLINDEMRPDMLQKLKSEVNQIKASARKTYADALGAENANKLFDSTFQFQVDQMKYKSAPTPDEMFNREFYEKDKYTSKHGKSYHKAANFGYKFAHSLGKIISLGLK